MMNRMIFANLVHRPIRSLISIVAIALEVILILLIVGLSLGILNDSKERQAGIGADVIVLPPGSSAIVGVTGAPAPIKVADKVAKLPHVTVVSPVIMQLSTSKSLDLIYGVDLKTFDQLAGPFRFLQGGPFQGPQDALVDDIFAQANHVKAGQTIVILNHDFRVAGVVAHGKGARKYLPLETLQDLTGAQGKASAFYVKLDSPSNAAEVVDEVKAIPGMEDYAVRPMSEYLTMMAPSNIPLLSGFINVVIGIAVIIGFIVIFEAMYAAVMERTREIGILKSIGASKFYIVDAILRETALLAFLGTGVGIAVSLMAGAVIRQRSTLPVVVTPHWILKTAVIAFTGALVGAFYPALKAARKDPIDALAYE
jgi:putative ABC transport system permease protein